MYVTVYRVVSCNLQLSPTDLGMLQHPLKCLMTPLNLVLSTILSVSVLVSRSFMVGPAADAVNMCTAAGTVTGSVAAALQFFALAQCLIQEPWPKAAQVQSEYSLPSRYAFRLRRT